MRRSHLRPVLLACFGLLAGLVSIAPSAGPAEAGANLGGFISETIVSGLSIPTDFAFAPDGRIFIAQKSGAVRVFKVGQLLPDPFIVLTVNTHHEHGLLGLALDPDFDTNGYIYLYYVVENSPDSFSGPKTAQLLRVTANGDVALPGSELVLLGSITGDAAQPSCSDFPAGVDCIPADGASHNGGGLRFASDGKLFLAIGDGELFLPSQDLDSFSGKIVRINPDGSAPLDNPFFTGDPAAVRSKVWAYGLRNPFRFGLQPNTDLPFIGDVGGGLWEEIDVGTAGANFGWPCYEGSKQQLGGEICESLYAAGTHTQSLYAYSHPPGAAVVGGVFYQGVNYPPSFQNAFYYGDYVRNLISSLRVDSNNNLIPGSVTDVILDADGPVDLEIGPEGNVYYLSILTGQVRRIRYETGNRPPVANATASPTVGLPPLSVQFSSEGSFDPDLQTISFQWAFGDGATSTEANPTHVFTQDGDYVVTLTVTDSEGATGADTVAVEVGNHAPTATITAPQDGTIYQVGDTITFAGVGTDPDDGELVGDSLGWDVILHHCETQLGSCHTHPFWQTAGSGGTFVTIGDDGSATEIVFYEISLTATDSLGASSTSSVTISADSDGDGLSDQQELQSFGTDPHNTDSDSDGIPDGDEDFDGDGCGNLRELGTDETLGGLRDPLNPWDYFDVNGDKHIDVPNDLLPVILAYLQGPLDPGGPGPLYTAAKDRGPPKPGAQFAWQRTGPDGHIDVPNDLLPIILQYLHTCK